MSYGWKNEGDGHDNKWHPEHLGILPSNLVDLQVVTPRGQVDPSKIKGLIQSPPDNSGLRDYESRGSLSTNLREGSRITYWHPDHARLLECIVCVNNTFDFKLIPGEDGKPFRLIPKISDQDLVIAAIQQRQRQSSQKGEYFAATQTLFGGPVSDVQSSYPNRGFRSLITGQIIDQVPSRSTALARTMALNNRGDGTIYFQNMQGKIGVVLTLDEKNNPVTKGTILGLRITFPHMEASASIPGVIDHAPIIIPPVELDWANTTKIHGKLSNIPPDLLYERTFDH